MIAVVLSINSATKENFEIEEVHLFRNEKVALDGVWKIVKKRYPGFGEVVEGELPKMCQHSFPCHSFKEHFLKTLEKTTRWYGVDFLIDILPSHHVHTND